MLNKWWLTCADRSKACLMTEAVCDHRREWLPAALCGAPLCLHPPPPIMILKVDLSADLPWGTRISMIKSSTSMWTCGRSKSCVLSRAGIVGLQSLNNFKSFQFITNQNQCNCSYRSTAALRWSQWACVSLHRKRKSHQLWQQLRKCN